MRSSRTVIALLILVGVIALLALSIAERDVAYALAAFIGLLLALAMLDPQLVDDQDRTDDRDGSHQRFNPGTQLPMATGSTMDIGGSPFGMECRPPRDRIDG